MSVSQSVTFSFGEARGAEGSKTFRGLPSGPFTLFLATEPRGRPGFTCESGPPGTVLERKKWERVREGKREQERKSGTVLRHKRAREQEWELACELVLSCKPKSVPPSSTFPETDQRQTSGREGE